MFVVPKPEQKWRPVIDLQIEHFPESRKIQNVNTRTIRASLNQREWVTSVCLQMSTYTSQSIPAQRNIRGLPRDIKSISSPHFRSAWQRQLKYSA